MPSKRMISAKDVVSDIKAGLSNLALMEKYQLSSKGLLSAFTKLIESNAVSEDNLRGRMPIFDDTVCISHERHFPRCYPALGLPIYDKESPEVEYHVLDLTENGVQVVDINAEVGEKRSFVIKAEGLDESIRPCAFNAECRWVREDTEIGRSVAGFEITDMSDRDLEAERHIIALLTFCDD